MQPLVHLAERFWDKEGRSNGGCSMVWFVADTGRRVVGAEGAPVSGDPAQGTEINSERFS
jgi:hypothetical protein